jgi:hypothetical protein
MEPKDWAAIATIVISSLTFVVVVLNFRRSRRIDSEGMIFKYKSEGYLALLDKLTSVMDMILDAQAAVISINSGGANYTQNDFEIKATRIDHAISHFSNDMIKHSLFFSKEIVMELENLTDYLYKDQENDGKVHFSLKTLAAYYQEFLEKANRLHDLMRRDLHVDQLNKSLSKRLQGNFASK